jgi:cytochrome c oxidase subunit 3
MDKTITYNKVQPQKNDQMTSLVGMVILLGSLTMFFIAILASYGVLRVRSSSWGIVPMSNLAISLSWLNLVVILSSSVVFSKIHQIAKEKTLEASISWINSTIICGVLFLGFQIFIWSILSADGFLITSHQAGSVFYMVSGLHGIHLLIGIFLLFWLRRKIKKHEAELQGIRLIGYFWHFLTILWLIIFFSVIIF